ARDERQVECVAGLRDRARLGSVPARARRRHVRRPDERRHRRRAGRAAAVLRSRRRQDPLVTTGVAIRTSAMYRAQQAAGARFTETAGWRVADVYTSTDEEMARAHGGIGLGDVSACGKLGVRGEAVESLAMKLTGRMPPIPGRAAWERLNGARVLLCRKAGGEVLVLTTPEEYPAVADSMARSVESAGCAHLTDLTAAFAVVDLMGPAVPALLERLVAFDVSEIPP